MKALRLSLTVALLVFCGPAFPQDDLQHLKFVSDVPGPSRVGWRIIPAPNNEAILRVVPGKFDGDAAEILMAPQAAAAPGAILNYSLDASPYRGKVVQFEFAMRAEAGESPELSTFIRSDTATRLTVGIETTPPHKTAAGERQLHHIVARVPHNAGSLTFGLRLSGAHRAWLDSVSAKVVSDAEAGWTPPRPLSAQGLTNLVVFTRLLGYVRFFHPSDEAAVTNWDNFAIASVPSIEAAKDARALVTALNRIFLPIAPTMRVFVGRPDTKVANGTCANCVGWKHWGVGLKQGSIYRSERVVTEPAAPIVTDLGGGVWAVVPLTLPRDSSGTLPQTTLPDRESASAIILAPSGNDRTTRLADIVLAWPVFQHFYPYFDVVKTDWNMALRDGLSRAALDADELAFEHTLSRLVAALHDGHGAVTHGPRIGIPVVWDWIEDQLVVTAVNPATAAGLRIGDVILKINGRSVADASAALQAEISAATPQLARQVTLRLLALCQYGEPITVQARHEDGTVFTATPDPNSPRPTIRLPAPIAELKPDIWYVDVSRATGADADGAMEKLAMASAIVFDMRGYPTGDGFRWLSHLTNRTLHSDKFEIPITTQPDHHGVTYDDGGLRFDPATPRFKGKYVFLTGPSAISAAETFMGLVAGEKLGPIVGATTAGTNGNINPFTLPGEYTLSWTGLRTVKQNGSPYHGVGTSPDYPVAQTLAGVRAGRDEVLMKGLEIAGSMAAE